MKRKPWIITAAAVLCSFTIRAQSAQDTLRFSLQEALTYATGHAFENISAEYDIQESQKKVWEYLAKGMPQVNVSGQFSDNLSLQENIFSMAFEDGRVETIKAKFGQKYNMNLAGNASQMIFDGTYFLGVRASKIYVELSEKNKVKTEIAVRGAVTESYYLALIAGKNVEKFKANLHIMEQTLNETSAYFQNGFREQTDVDQVKLMVNNQKNLVLEAERQQMITQVVLKYAMGIAMEQPIVLSDQLDNLIIPVEANLVTNEPYQYESNIDFSIMETQEEAQRLILKNEKMQFLPKLDAFFNYNYIRFGDKLNSTDKTNASMWGLTLNVPVFASGMKRSRVNQEKIKFLKLQNQKTQLEEGLKQAHLVAQSNLENAKAVYLNNKEGEEIAGRIVEKTRIKFANGLSSSTELSQNESQYIQAQMNQIQSTINLMKAHIEYQKAIGQL